MRSNGCQSRGPVKKMKDHQGECTFKKEGRKMELVIIQYDVVVVFVVVVMFFNLKLAFNRHVRC